MRPVSLSNSRFHHLLFGLILIVGVVLRIGDLSSMAFINDELSTWDKVSPTHISDVIHTIHYDDSHPVGLYVFMYFWTNLFGDSVTVFKLPFLILSILSLILIYRIASQLFNKNTGLFSMAYFASLQFPIWWSAIARQYQFGLFFFLMSVYFFLNIKATTRPKKLDLIGFTLGLACCMYIHYFSLFMAFLLGVFALVVIPYGHKKKILIAGCIAVFLFSPHIPITLYQLSNADGHLWYQTPDFSFIPNYIFYVFHYSMLCFLCLVTCVLLTFSKAEKPPASNLLFCVFIFFGPIIFGLFYSIYISPILRETHLLFSLPFFFIFFFAWSKTTLSTLRKGSVVLLVLTINTGTLVSTRQHFSVVNSHPYHHFVSQTHQFLNQPSSNNTKIYFNENPTYIKYYMDKLSDSFQYVSTFRQMPPLPVFMNQIQDPTIEHLILGSMPATYLQVALDEFPNLLSSKYGVNYDYYILSRNTGTPFSYFWSDSLTDSRSQKTIVLDSTQSYSPTYTHTLSSITESVYDYIDLRAEVGHNTRMDSALLVLEFKKNGQQIAWSGKEFKWQLTPNNKGYIYHSILCSHYLDKRMPLDNISVHCYIWNKGKQIIELKNIRLRTRKQNPLLYKDTEPF